MVYLYSLLVTSTILVALSAAPITIPLGSSGQSLSISEDGEILSIGDRTIDLSGSTCSGGRGRKHHSGNGKNNGAAATNTKAIYFITNAAENSVVALKVASDGTVSDGTITPTGGNGSTGVDAKGAPAVPDGLFSQGAVKVAGKVRSPFHDRSFVTEFPELDCREPRLQHYLNVQH